MGSKYQPSRSEQLAPDKADPSPQGVFGFGSGVTPTTVLAAAGGLGVAALWSRYRVAQAAEALIKTGLGVKNISISRTTMQWPLQKVQVVKLHPHNYTFQLQMISAELVPFKLPVVFTIGPKDPSTDEKGFTTFATRLADLDQEERLNIIGGVIHGQTRVFSAQLTIKQMFADRDVFKNTVQKRIQEDLDDYGLHIYNANIAEMADVDHENKYFENLKKKALEEANTEARIQVAEARKLGDVGEKQRQGAALIQLADIEAEVALQQNLRERTMAESEMELAVKRAAYQQAEQIAQTESTLNSKKRELELQREVELSKAAQQVEALRATEMAQAEVDAECLVRAAEGRSAARVKDMEGEAAALKQLADAQLYQEQRKAEGLKAVFNAQAEGLQSLCNVTQGQPELAKFYMGMNSGLYEKMAGHTAEAVRGMAPKVNIWSTGGDAPNSQGLFALRDLFKAVPPMLDAVEQQTDLKVASWMGAAAGMDSVAQLKPQRETPAKIQD